MDEKTLKLEKKILKHMEKNGTVFMSDLIEYLKVGVKDVFDALMSLKAKGLIENIESVRKKK